jgi:hypothetical protein
LNNNKNRRVGQLVDRPKDGLYMGCLRFKGGSVWVNTSLITPSLPPQMARSSMRHSAIQHLADPFLGTVCDKPFSRKEKRMIVMQRQGDNPGQSTISASRKSSKTVQKRLPTHKTSI